MLCKGFSVITIWLQLYTVLCCQKSFGCAVHFISVTVLSKCESFALLRRRVTTLYTQKPKSVLTNLIMELWQKRK